jgi:uncharacterized membrane protein
MKEEIILDTSRYSIWIVFGGLLLWLAGIFCAPLLAASADPLLLKLSSILYYFYQPTCHQLAERSLLIDGFALSVCIRCLAVYLGGLTVSGIYLFKFKTNIWPLPVYILLAGPAALDFLTEKFIVYDPSGIIRFISGLLLGIALFQLLILSLTAIKPVYNQHKTRYQKV